MTASLPLPDDDGGRGPVVPPLPPLSAADAAASDVAEIRPSSAARKPRAPRATKAATTSGTASSAAKIPGAKNAGAKKPPRPRAPRNPRPVIPPIAPPPPPPVESAADAAARLQHAGDDPEVTAEIATEDAVAPAVDDARDADSALEIDPEPAVAVEPAPEIDPEHAAELEPEPALEPSVELEPEPAVEPESAVEPEIEVEPVPEAGPALPDDPEPESAVEREPVIEPDVVVERDLADALDAAIAPETADDVDGDAEPDADDADDDLDLLIADPLADLDVEVDTAVPALSLRGVSKSFGSTRAVDDIDLTVPAGTFYGIVGPNGAGKTTTLSMIAGLLRADSGSISVTGIDLARDPAGAKRRMGILPDRLRTFDRLTGRQLLHYYGVLRGLRSGVVESRIADLARAFDLTDALGRAVSDYSTGMTKKLMLAGAMIHSPRVLVLDEPFESVDPVSSAVILDILSAYVAHGGTVILSSHGMDLVERVCSGVAVIVAGQVLAAGTVAEVRGESTLEERFIELSGGLGDVEGLEWLHTFSD